MPRYLGNLGFIDGAWVNEIYPEFFGEHEHLLPGYKLRGVGTLSSPCLYSDLHAGVPAATLFFLQLLYVRICVVRGYMGRYKS
jgi:hypothetical protein